jgi:pimeloyl-ACP methyl ester carboxylesterase
MIASDETFDGHLPVCAPFLKALWPKGPVVELPNAGHVCQEDVPEILVALIQQFIQMTR